MCHADSDLVVMTTEILRNIMCVLPRPVHASHADAVSSRRTMLVSLIAIVLSSFEASCM